MSTAHLEQLARQEITAMSQWLKQQRERDGLWAVSGTISDCAFDGAEGYTFTVYVHAERPGGNLCESGDGPTLAAAYDKALARLIEKL